MLIDLFFFCYFPGRLRAISGHNLRQNVGESGLGPHTGGRRTEGAAPYRTTSGSTKSKLQLLRAVPLLPLLLLLLRLVAVAS